MKKNLIFTLGSLVVFIALVIAYNVASTDGPKSDSTSSPSTVTNPNINTAAPPSTTKENDAQLVFKSQSTNGLTGTVDLITSIYSDGTWVSEDSYPKDMQTGKLSKKDIRILKDLVNAEAPKLYKDESLIVMCKPQPDASSYTYTYYTQAVNPVFDSCFIGGNNREDLFIKTVEVLKQIATDKTDG